jgi:pyruvate kinase
MIMQKDIQLSLAETICNCAVKAAYEMNAKLIIVFTNSGSSAILVSKYRPQCPILAVSASDTSAKQIMISRGIFNLLVGSLIGAESLLEKVMTEAKNRGLVVKGDHVIVTTGVNEGLEGSTNLLKVLKV